MLASAGIGAGAGMDRTRIPDAGRPGARAAERARDAAAAGGHPPGSSSPSWPRASLAATLGPELLAVLSEAVVPFPRCPCCGPAKPEGIRIMP